MAYDEGLAERLRDALQGQADISERKMFGGLAFLSRGHMVVGILGDVLMARVGPQGYAQALTLPHVREMDFTGKPMRGYVFVDPPSFEQDADLIAWVERCLGWVQSLPAKRSR
ncbi:TfoX/Sxy family protein [Pseudomonas zhanjiangensis]|uniref:TfoX/Sxy family protein n=1 Tax=Pseudomonas zhanjiangensis TaxID=3239015 RepID=A0ABV3YX89_9PSED